jgi:DNA-binding NarL/FixJ family response regulator
MKRTTFHTVIAGGNPLFRSRLKSILKMAESESHDFSASMIDAATIDDLERELQNHVDVAFIDSSVVVKDSKRLARIWRKTHSECSFAVVLSDSHAAELKNVIYEMEKQRSLPADIHILKHNYPDELIMRVVLRMVELCIAQKNLAVV